MGTSIDKLIPKNLNKQQAGRDWLQELNGGPPQQGVMQQMQPLLNQLLGHHGGKSTRLNMDGTLKDMNAPSGLDWLEAHGPDRASVQERKQRLGQELRPNGGLPWMAQQGAQAVEAQKQMQSQPQHSVKQQWGGDDVGPVSVATRNGQPVGFSTSTPQAKSLHQFSPTDFVSMLNQLPQEPQATVGSTPQPGAEQLPVNAFVGHTTNNPDNFFVRDKAGVRAREQERQRHNVYKDQVQPNFMDYVSAFGEQLDMGGQQQGNMLADLFGYSDKLPPLPPTHIKPPATREPRIQLVDPPQQTARQMQGNSNMADLLMQSAHQLNPSQSFIPPPSPAKNSPTASPVTPDPMEVFWDSPLPWLTPWLTPAEGQQLKQKLNEQATYKFPW